MTWSIANNEEEIRFLHYTERFDLEDGRIAFWEAEDWEIYGEGGGGYTSSGPIDPTVQLLDWFQSGMMLGQDILKWRSGNRENATSARNFPTFQGMSPSLCDGICCFSCGPRISMINGVVGFGAAREYEGTSNPQVGVGDVMPGDIVVIGRRDHADQSFSIQYRAFNPLGNDHADFAENYEFLAVAMAESDALAGVTADYSHLGGPPSPELVAAFEAMKGQIEAILANLQGLPADSYFTTRYIDAGGSVQQGRIRVSELIMWFSRIDFEFYPAAYNFGNGGVGQTYVTSRSNMNRADVTLRVDETAFRGWAFQHGLAGNLIRDPAGNPTINYGQITWYLIHEITHATSFGETVKHRYGNGVPLEKLVNGFALGLARTIAPTYANSRDDRSSIENERQSVEGYVKVVRPDPETGVVYDLTPPSDATTTFVVPTI